MNEGVVIKEYVDAKAHALEEADRVLRLDMESHFNSLVNRIANASKSQEDILEGFKDLSNARLAGINDRFTSIETAVKVAADGMDKRMDSVNEFRGQLKDQTATFMPRTEVMNLVEAVNNRLSTIEKQMANYQGQLLIVGVVAAFVGTLIPIAVGFIFHH